MKTIAGVLIALFTSSIVGAAVAGADPDPRLQGQLCSNRAYYSMHVQDCSGVGSPAGWGSNGDHDEDGVPNNVDIDHLTGDDHQ